MQSAAIRGNQEVIRRSSGGHQRASEGIRRTCSSFLRLRASSRSFSSSNLARFLASFSSSFPLRFASASSSFASRFASTSSCGGTWGAISRHQSVTAVISRHQSVTAAIGRHQLHHHQRCN
jgi:hypothetical protein